MPKGRPTHSPRSSLGARILKARQDAGLTQEELAAKLGVTQRVIAYWERESVSLKADQLKALADALDISADYLLGRTQKKLPKGGPVGRIRKVFERVNALPRHHQNKVIEMAEGFLALHEKAKA